MLERLELTLGLRDTPVADGEVSGVELRLMVVKLEHAERRVVELKSRLAAVAAREAHQWELMAGLVAGLVAGCVPGRRC